MTNLKTLTATTALTAAALLASTMAKAESWNDWVTQNNFTSSAVGDVTTINTTAAIASGTTLNASIAAGDTVNVNMGSSDHIFAVTDVNAGTMTQIDGALNSNGRIIIMDVDGVMFGGASTVDVAGLAAVAGEFNGIDTVTLSGDVTISAGANIQIGNGVAAFLGNSIINNGDIVSTGTGSILLAAGQTATVDLYGDDLVSLALSGNGTITHTGTIEAAQGKVYMTAAQAEDIVNTVINIDGIVNASTANVSDSGEIILTADTVNINEDLTANDSVTVNANETNLDARLKDGDDNNLDYTKISGTATTVNVLSDDASIQQGVDIAATGGTVNVADGTHNENVTLRKAITLVGNSNVDTILNGAFHINSGLNPSNVTINNFNIAGNSTYGVEIRSNGANFNMLNNRFTGTNNYGVFVQFPQGAVNIQGNQFNNGLYYGVYVLQPGPGYFGTIDNNTFTQNAYGVYALYFPFGSITNNTFTNNYNSAIHADGYDHLLVDNNTIIGSNVGIDLFAMSASTVTNNTLIGNLVGYLNETGWSFKRGNITFAGNTFTDNSIGAWFRSGIIDMTDETNSYNGGDFNLVLGPGAFEYPEIDYPEFNDEFDGEFNARLAAPIFYRYPRPKAESLRTLELVDNTIGTSEFNTPFSHYVYLQNGALFSPGTPTIIDGSQASYDGAKPADGITETEFNIIEAGINHYIDNQTLGLFFFDLPSDQTDVIPAGVEDIFKQIDPAQIPGGNVNLTITGLPLTGFETPSSLNDLAPAAGDKTDPKNLNELETAAGEEKTTTQCITNALNAASTGETTTYSFGSHLNQATIDAVTTCTEDI